MMFYKHQIVKNRNKKAYTDIDNIIYVLNKEKVVPAGEFTGNADPNILIRGFVYILYNTSLNFKFGKVLSKLVVVPSEINCFVFSSASSFKC